jgi:hypothetical protein
MSVTFRIS